MNISYATKTNVGSVNCMKKNCDYPFIVQTANANEALLIHEVAIIPKML